MLEREGFSAKTLGKILFHFQNDWSGKRLVLHNKPGSHGVLNANLFNFTFFLVDFGKVLCSYANELRQNSNASYREDLNPHILTVLLEIHRVYI